MANKLVIILAEGEHDAAFIYRILKANGLTTDHRVIKSYPYPLNDLFSRDILNTPIADLNIAHANSRFLPYRVMTDGDNMYLLYSIGGDSQKEKRVSIIKTVNAFNAIDPDAIQVMDDTEISILYFFDANSKGVDARIAQMVDEISEAMPGNQLKGITSGTLVKVEDLHIGAYIFREAGKDYGKLEDVLIPLMKDGNEDIFQAAGTFLEIHEETTLFKGKLTMEGTRITKVNGHKYDRSKSLLGTIGQLQKSGKSNTVCISDSDFLTDVKLKANTICNEIKDFILNAAKPDD